MRQRLLACALVVFAAGGLEGCATAAKPQAMIVQPQPAAVVNPKLKGALRVNSVSGGQSTNPMWASKVDNAGFKQALERSLSIAGYLAPSGSDAPFVLDANLQNLKQPLIGVSFDVTSSVHYRVTGVDVARDYSVTATGTATFSDAWVGVERLRIANENSINENIKALLRHLEAF